MNAIKAISYFFNLLLMRQEHLEKVKVTRRKLLNVCQISQLKRIEGVYLFEDLFFVIIMTLEKIFYNLKGKCKKETSVKSNSLLKLILNFDFIVKRIMSCQILDYAYSVTQIFQCQNIDIIKGLDLIKHSSKHTRIG